MNISSIQIKHRFPGAELQYSAPESVPFDSETNIFVNENVNPEFGRNVVDTYNSISAYNKKVSNVIVLSSPDASQLDDIQNLDHKSKKRIQKHLNGGAQDSYGFYTKKADSIIIIESNHNRKDEKYEGSIVEQGADTMLHEYAHILDDGISSSDKFKKAYYSDLKAIDKQLKADPDAYIPGSDMTYSDAIVYFDHYCEGADFSDGIDENDVTRRGLRENFAESFATVFDNQESKVNDIYRTLFPNSTDFVSEFVA